MITFTYNSPPHLVSHLPLQHRSCWSAWCALLCEDLCAYRVGETIEASGQNATDSHSSYLGIICNHTLQRRQKVHQFLNHKCFSDCYIHLVNFSEHPNGCFVNFVHLYSCFLEKEYASLFTWPWLEVLPYLTFVSLIFLVWNMDIHVSETILWGYGKNHIGQHMTSAWHKGSPW